MGSCGSKSNGLPALQVAGIKPGRYDPVYGCPPPTEIVCIVAKKVYDECKNTQIKEDEFVVYSYLSNPVVDVQFKSVELLDGPVCDDSRPGRVRVTFKYGIKIKVCFENNTEIIRTQEVTVVKSFHVPRAGEQGLEISCDIPFIEGLECVVKAKSQAGNQNKTIIVCCIGILLIIRLFAEVQLMVPAYGFCPEPPDCEEVQSGGGECPEFHFKWPPFPPWDG